MSLNNLSLAFGQSTVDSALELIEAENMHVIHCILTGSRVGVIDTAEIRLCLQMEVHRNPLISVDNLAESFSMRQYAMSSGPAPSLRVHKDHNALVRILKLDESGPARLLAYLTGRLFFESLIPDREIFSTEVRRARLAFLVDMQTRMADLPLGWSQSLTSDDEEIKPANKAVGMLSVIAGMKPSQEAEAKAAQKCLESLLRLDAIHNVKSAFYGNNMREQLCALRDSHMWTFSDFDRLLGELEADGIKRLNMNSMKPVGNAMVITSALEALSWSRKRMGISEDKFMESIEKGIDAGKLGIGTSSSMLLGLIRTALQKDKMSKADRKDLESALKQLAKNAGSVTYSDKRLNHLHHAYGKSGERLGTHRVIHGDTVTKHLVESYKDKGEKIPAPLRAKMDSLVKQGKVSKPGQKKGTKKPAGGVNRDALLSALGSFTFNLESK